MHHKCITGDFMVILHMTHFLLAAYCAFNCASGLKGVLHLIYTLMSKNNGVQVFHPFRAYSYATLSVL